MTYRECYEYGQKALKSAGVPEAETDARLLLEFVCHTDRNVLLAHGDREVAAEEMGAYEEMIQKRSLRIPLQQLTGIQNFMGLDFFVNDRVLIPRQDTEILVEEVLKYLHDGMRVLDMCTGSGCILVSILHYSNECYGVGADIAEDALAVAGINAKELLSGSDRYEFIQSNLFEKISGQFEVIVSNPPYIERKVIESLMPEVKDHEPLNALDGGEDGLDFYRTIVKDGVKHLCGGGMLFLEIGYNQGDAVRALMENAGFVEVTVLQDYGGLDRVVYGIWL